MKNGEGEEADSSTDKRGAAYWTEKYCPKRPSELVGHSQLREQLDSYGRTGEFASLLFIGPPGVGKTTAARILARSRYGEQWQSEVYVHDAAVESGINQLPTGIQRFVRSDLDSETPRLVILEHIDWIPSVAQRYLRFLLDQYTPQAQFLMTSNYSSRVLTSLQSQCTVYRMPPVARTEIEVYLEAIATEEGVQVGDDAIQLIAETADGDVRQAVTMLQAVAMGEKGVDMSDIRNLFSIAPPSKIESLVDAARRGDIRSARNRLESLIVDHGMAGEDIVDELHEQVLNRQLSEEMTIRLAERIGQTDYRLGQGADERLQVESLLASIVRLSRGSQATSSDSTTT